MTAPKEMSAFVYRIIWNWKGNVDKKIKIYAHILTFIFLDTFNDFLQNPSQLYQLRCELSQPEQL